MKIQGLFQIAVNRLKAAGIPDPETEASILLEHVLKTDRVHLLIEPDRNISPELFEIIEGFLSRRLRREPLAYILGEREFWSLPFIVTPDVLIPRPETELLVENALHVFKRRDPESAGTILDLGTGSGAIAIILAIENPDSIVYGVDCSFRATKIARVNAKIHGVFDRVRFFVSDWLSPVKQRPYFGLIVSNPPYVDTETIKGLQPEVRLYEPSLAIDGGRNGTEAIAALSSQIASVLVPGGWFFMEIGLGQDRYCMDLFASLKCYDCLDVHNDYAGISRIFQARKIIG